MNFKQLEHEHVAQSWEKMKMMLRNCPTHELNLWMIIQKIYAGLNFVSRNLLDSAAGGTFMEITLGEATKFLDNIMTNYSQWHTERAPTSKKVNSVEEISSLSEKVDALMKLVASKSAPIYFNDMPLSTLIEQNSDAIDVNLISRNNFNNNAYRGNFNPRPFPSNSSNVSIVYEAFMLLYYLFWMFMGFILHFYIIFGTNLLTQSPMPVFVFFLVLEYHKKGK